MQERRPLEPRSAASRPRWDPPAAEDVLTPPTEPSQPRPPVSSSLPPFPHFFFFYCLFSHPSPLADAVMWAADGWTCARRTHTGTYLDWFCQPIFIKRCRGIFSCYASLLWNGGALKCLTALSSLLRPPHLLPPISPLSLFSPPPAIPLI